MIRLVTATVLTLALGFGLIWGLEAGLMAWGRSQNPWLHPAARDLGGK